jgi:hypothetical protein
LVQVRHSGDQGQTGLVQPYILESGFVGMPAATRWRPAMHGPQMVLVFVSLADLSTLTRLDQVAENGRVAATTLRAACWRCLITPT